MMFLGARERHFLDSLGLLGVLCVTLAFAISYPWGALATIFGSVAVFFISGRVDLGLWLIVVLTPLETVLGVGFRETKAIKLGLVALIACVCLGRAYAGRGGGGQQTKDLYLRPLVFLLATGFIATVLASSPRKSAVGLATFLIYVLYYLGLRRSEALVRLGPRLLRTVVLLALPTAALAFLQLTQGYGGMLGSNEQQADAERLTTLWPTITRASATFGSANAAGAFLGIGALIAVVHAVVYRKHRTWFILAATISVLGLLATFSRGALLGLIAGLVFGFWGLGYLKLRWRLLLPLSAILLTVGILFSFDEVGGYFRLGTDVVSASTSRVDVWHAAFTLIRRNPVVGIGFYQFQDMSQGIEGVQDTPIHPHNGFLKALVEQGPIGGFAYLLFLFAFLKTSVKSMRRFSQNLENRWMFGSIGSIGVCLFTQELVDAGFTMGGSSLAILFATLLGLQVSLLQSLPSDATVEKNSSA
jgi:O-antigen ligase